MAVGISTIRPIKVGVRKTGIPAVPIKRTGLTPPYRPYNINKKEREHVKDLGDILFGDFTSGTLELQHTLEDAGLGRFKNRPFLGRFLGYGAMLNERVWNPLFKGDVLTLAANTLETVGYTMDTVANPVKSLFVGTGGGNTGDLKRSMGWIEGEYRKNFDWNTGNWGKDLLYEVLSDPLNLIGFGKVAVNKISKYGMKEVLSEAASNAIKRRLIAEGVQVGTDVGQETLKMTTQRVAKKLTRLALEESDDFLEKAIRYIEDDIRVKELITEAINKVSPVKDGVNTLRKLDLTPTQLKKLSIELSDVYRSSHYQQFKIINKVLNPILQIDDVLIRTALSMTPIGYTWGLYKKVLTPTAKAMSNFAKRRMNLVKLSDILDNAPGTLEKVASDLFTENQKMHSEVYKKWDAVLESHGISVEKVQRMYVGILQDIPVERHNTDVINRIFKQKLIHEVPELNDAVATKIAKGVSGTLEVVEETSNAVTTPKIIEQLDVEELLQAVEEVGIEVYGAQLGISDLLLETLKRDMVIFLGKSDSTTSMDMFGVNEILKYINQRTLRIGDKHYGFRKLDTFLADLKQLPIEEQTAIYNILNYFGITVDNATEIARLASDMTSDNLKAIKAILEVGKTGKVNIYRESEKISQGVLNGVKKAAKNIADRDDLGLLKQFKSARITKADLGVEELLTRELNNVLDFKLDLTIWIHDFQQTTETWEQALERLFLRLQESKLVPIYEEELELSNNILKILKFNTDNPGIKEIRELVTAIEDINSRTYGLIKKIEDARSPELRDLESLFRNLRVTTQAFKNKPIYDSVLDSLDVLNTMYYLQLSRQEMFYWIDFEVFQDIEEKHYTWFKELVNPNSVTRSNIMSLARVLDANEYSAVANDIRHLITTIDCHAAMRKVLSSHFNDVGRRVPDALNKYLQGEMLNQIYKNGDLYASIGNIKIQEMVDQIIKDLEWNKKNTIWNSLVDSLKYGKDLDAQKTIFDFGIETPVKLEIMNPFVGYGRDAAQVEIISEAYEEEIRRIRVLLSQHLNEYVNTVKESGRRAGIANKLYEPFSDESIIFIERIAQDKAEILKDISKLDPDNVYRTELENLSSIFAGTSEEVTNINLVKEVQQLAAKGVDNARLGAQAREAIDNNIALKIKTAFNKINERNKVLAGTDEAGHKLHKITNYYTYQELDKILKNMNAEANIHSWSTENGMYAFKKVYDDRFVKTLGASYGVEALGFTSNIDYINFINCFQKMMRRVDAAVQELDVYKIRRLQEALIKTYSRPGIDFAPKDVTGFFMNISPKELRAWDMLTRSNMYPTNKKFYEQYFNEYVGATKRTIQEIRDYKQNPDRFFEAIDAVAVENPFNEVGSWDRLVMEAPTQGALNEVYDAVNKELTMKLTSTENMIKYKYAYAKWFTEDVDALSKLDYITEAELNLAGTPNAFKKMYNERTTWHAQSVAHMDAAQLRSYIDHNTDGSFIFVNRNIKLERAPFLFTEQELKWNGLRIDFLDEEKTIFHVRRTDNLMNPKKAKYVYTESKVQEAHDKFNKLFTENRNYMNMDDMDIPAQILTGDSVDPDFWEFLIETYPKQFGDLEIRKLYQKLTPNGLNSFYTKKYNRPNGAILGGTNAYNIVIDLVKGKAQAAGKTFHYKSNELNKVAQVNMINYIQRVNKLHKYTTMFFNDQYFIDNQQFKTIFKNKTNEELADFFKKNNYAAVVLRENSRGKPNVYKYYITNRKTLNEAIQQGAICVPDAVYRNMVLAVNKNMFESKWLNFYRRTIVGTYKSMWLFSLGYLFRNATDSLFYKNLNELGGLTALPELIKYEYRASKILAWYDDIQKTILESGIPKDLVGKISAEEAAQYMSMNRNMVLKHLSGLSGPERELYITINAFIESGANGGFSKSFEDFLINFNKANVEGELEFKWAKYYNEKILHGKYNPVTLIQTTNSWIEQTARLGLFLNLLEHGTNVDSAIARVFATHFDYAFKTSGQDLLEQLFWFSTFPINNVAYYINDGIVKSPIMFKLQMDANQLSWNSDGYTYDEVAKKRYLSYNMMVGNIRIGDTIIKTGSSVFDFFNLFIDPVGEARDRLNPFLAVPLGLDELSQLNPITSIINRTNRLAEGKSLIPSIYDKINVYPRDKKYFTDSYRGNWKGIYGRYAKRGKKYRQPRNQSFLAYRYYNSARIYRTTSRLKWKNTTTLITPQFWTRSDKYYAAIGKLRRADKKIRLSQIKKTSTS